MSKFIPYILHIVLKDFTTCGFQFIQGPKARLAESIDGPKDEPRNCLHICFDTLGWHGWPLVLFLVPTFLQDPLSHHWLQSGSVPWIHREAQKQLPWSSKSTGPHQNQLQPQICPWFLQLVLWRCKCGSSLCRKTKRQRSLTTKVKKCINFDPYRDRADFPVVFDPDCPPPPEITEVEGPWSWGIFKVGTLTQQSVASMRV